MPVQSDKKHQSLTTTCNEEKEEEEELNEKHFVYVVHYRRRSRVIITDRHDAQSLKGHFVRFGQTLSTFKSAVISMQLTPPGSVL